MAKLSEIAYEIFKARYAWDNENSWEALAERVCREVAKNEQKDQDFWYNEFYSIIEPMLFVPAGRILRNIGKLRPATSNCNFLPIEDNIESIFNSLGYYGVISAYGGGSGLNFSSLRPKGANLITRGGASSGMVSFIEMFNFCGSKIETGGNRRAAGIALCDISHPEVIDFINAKTEEDRLNQFNISVIINDDFLNAVEANEDWDLKFAGKVYNTLKARDLWNLILDNMLKYAEPGLINWDHLKKNNTYYFSPIMGVNPCGEVPLGNMEVCNLGAISLPHFITNKNTNLKALARTIKLAVRFLDNIIDLAYYPISGQEQAVKNARRIGLGTMGLADYFFMKEIRYGSEKSLVEIEKLYKFIRDEAYISSVELAKEKGAFPKFDKIKYSNASFIRKLPPKIRMLIKENTIRNATCLAAAPTGTTSIIAGVSSGIEPIPFKAYRRVDGVGERIFISEFCKDNYKADWFVDSYDLKPEEHIDVQATIQKYIDGGVSKTILLPEKTTVANLNKILLEGIRDLKGVTVYRDNSRKKQVYYRLSEKEIGELLKSDKFSSERNEDDVSCATGTCEI